MGLEYLPKAKWFLEGKQPGLKEDMAHIEAAILESFGILAPPTIEWVDATSIKVPATPDDIAPVMMCGFPSQLHRGLFISGGLTDGRYRKNTADVVLDLDLAASLWGTEKISQWYVICALAGNADTEFSIKGMPFMRVKSQADQVISLGTLVTPATGIGYGFTADELAGGKIYVFSGASRGRLRAITANNNDDTTGGTVTYGGSALTLAQGDWLAVLPPTNFRLIGSVFNNSGGDIVKFRQLGNWVEWLDLVQITNATSSLVEDIRVACPLATAARITAKGNVRIGHPAAAPGSRATIAGGGSYVYNNVGSTTYQTTDFNLEFCKYVVDAPDPIYCAGYGNPGLR